VLQCIGCLTQAREHFEHRADCLDGLMQSCIRPAQRNQHTAAQPGTHVGTGQAITHLATTLTPKRDSKSYAQLKSDCWEAERVDGGSSVT
jgi:hypothetical protein